MGLFDDHTGKIFDGLHEPTWTSGYHQVACICPVCRGHGIVMQGFCASVQSEAFTGTGETEQCRSCKGKGYVWHDES